MLKKCLSVRCSTTNSSTYLHKILNQSATLNGTRATRAIRRQSCNLKPMRVRKRDKERQRNTDVIPATEISPLAIALESTILQERNCSCVHISPNSIAILSVCLDSFACARYVCCPVTDGTVTIQPRTW